MARSSVMRRIISASTFFAMRPNGSVARYATLQTGVAPIALGARSCVATIDNATSSIAKIAANVEDMISTMVAATMVVA